ncbi:hypothetical protein F4776DRAFT_638182 [Hypoxylon sp. NC0597]|nr:hypothetical protein F4776DRAFT_638182 [Hypoxylon sp. NC0597]
MPRVGETMPLKPAKGIHLSSLELAKSEFTELFTYNTLEKPGIDPNENHPELGRRAATSIADDSINLSAVSTSIVPAPKNTENFAYTSSEDDVGEKEVARRVSTLSGRKIKIVKYRKRKLIL